MIEIEEREGDILLKLHRDGGEPDPRRSNRGQ